MTRYRDHDDQAAFGTLMQRYKATALAMAEGRLPQGGLAEDAVQETFVRIARAAERYDPQRPFSAWFHDILIKVCIDAQRKQSRYRERLTDWAAQRPEAAAPADEDRPLRRALAVLNDSDREILLLRAVQGLSFHEIGQTLRCSESAAKKRGQRALRRLAKLLNRGLGRRLKATSPFSAFL